MKRARAFLSPLLVFLLTLALAIDRAMDGATAKAAMWAFVAGVALMSLIDAWLDA